MRLRGRRDFADDERVPAAAVVASGCRRFVPGDPSRRAAGASSGVATTTVAPACGRLAPVAGCAGAASMARFALGFGRDIGVGLAVAGARARSDAPSAFATTNGSVALGALLRALVAQQGRGGVRAHDPSIISTRPITAPLPRGHNA